MKENSNIKILSPLKNGGQKQVFLAEHEIYGNVVLKRGKCNSKSSLDRIIREVDILKNIKSMHFPKNFEFKYDNDGNFEIIEELVNGMNLSDCLDYFDTEDKIIIFALELVNGMKNLWNQKIVHRDLKPDNIMVTSNFKPIIIDLGIARDLDAKSLTKTIYLMGPCTPIYASPEQLQNRKNLIDARSDFFSIGIILTEMFLKANPFSPQIVGHGVSIEENILNDQFKVSTLEKQFSSGMEQFIVTMLQHQPFNRFRNYHQIEEVLKELI